MESLRKVILWGGTGQAKVNRPIIEADGAKVVAVFDDTQNLKPPFNDIPLYHGWSGFESWLLENRAEETGFCISIGNPHGRVRLALHDKLLNKGLKPFNVIHKSAILTGDILIGNGVQIMAGAIIQPEVRIGKQCIINTKASVDHECVLEDGVEITVGATLCGNVFVETNGWICAGATVLPRIRIGHDSIVGAGSVVTGNVPPNVVVYGVPAKIVRSR